jgi:class 3 adenylate cyclase
MLFTDIVDSTTHASNVGDERWRHVLEGHHRVVRRRLAEHGGREVLSQGDGFLLTFDLPSSAIRCARALMDDLAADGVVLRAGVHAGECEVIEDGANIAGLSVHIGARVAEAAGPGEIVVSGTVKELVAGSGLRFRSRGTHTLRGIPGKWQLHRALKEGERSRQQAIKGVALRSAEALAGPLSTSPLVAPPVKRGLKRALPGMLPAPGVEGEGQTQQDQTPAL